MIDFAAVSVNAADGQPILTPLTLQLSQQRIAIIGANGSGKSTLARLINGLVLPSSGAVTVHLPAHPKPLDTAHDGAAIRRQISFIFTDPAAGLIMPTAAEDIELSLRNRHRRRAARQQAALQVLKKFHLAEFAERSVHALSGGQQQLLAIAAALATDPAIVVADEPTTLLDLLNSQRIGDLLCALPQQLLVVTHDLELAARMERVLVMHEGQLVCDADPAAAIEHYRSLVRAC